MPPPAHHSLPNLALSRSTLNRSSERRADPELIGKLWDDATTKVLLLAAGAAPVRASPSDGSFEGDGPALVLAVRSGAQWGEVFGNGWGVDLTEAAFLGVDEAGAAYLSVVVPEGLPLPEGERWADLRAAGSDLDDTGAGVLVAAVAVHAWHAAHQRCARCGNRTDVTNAGWTRKCGNCGTEHYPRTDPAVIMAIVDADDRILLGRQAVWPEGRFSTLAGFVEPGEPLEAAVRREVAEESGVVVGDVSYRGSQPWPFPSSLMLGFRGEALTTDVTVDGEELAEAKWWSREQLAADIAAGALTLPPILSISRRLIEDWFGAELDGPDAWR